MPDSARTAKAAGFSSAKATAVPNKQVAFNDDGEALCQDCLISWTLNYAEESAS
jgi:hypothetical protein